jgi:cold shock CspA family protein
MAKSQQTFNKIEKEKARAKKREDKKKKKNARKADAKEGGPQGIQFAYVDHFGNLTDTPPNPADKVKVEAESIEIGIPKRDDSDIEEIDPIRKGKVSFYDSSKGFGFIIDLDDNEKYFCHVSGLLDDIQEDDKVQFELEKGQRGMNAVRVKKV